jgi:hypothetical protein
MVELIMFAYAQAHDEANNCQIVLSLRRAWMCGHLMREVRRFFWPVIKPEVAMHWSSLYRRQD